MGECADVVLHTLLIQLKLILYMRRSCVAIAAAMSVFAMSCGSSGNRVSLELAEHQNWEGAKLHGNIAYIAEVQYELAGSYGRVVKTELMSQKLVEFNERGDVTLSAEYDIDSMLLERREYIYDDKGYVLDYVHQGEGYKFENKYKRDKYGYVVERNLLKADGSLDMRYTTEYDACGNVVEEAQYSSDNVLQRKVETEYDDQHKPVEVRRYSGDGTLQRSEEYAYDSNGRLMQWHEYDTFDKLESRKAISYGANGKDEDVVVYDGNGGFDSRYVNRYDANGNLVEYVTYDSNGAVVERIVTIV